MNGSKPEWVIVGFTLSENKVAVMGSTSLTETDLVEETEWAKTWGGPPRKIAEWHTLTAQMRGYKVAIADNYHMALAILFEEWDPTQVRELT
jgi:hypothetical protein